MQTDRRSFMRATGAAALLGATGVAGCGSILGGGGGSGSWIYDPRVMADVPNTGFGSMAYGTLYDNRDELPQSMRESFQTNPDSPLQPEDIDNFAGSGGGDIADDGSSGAAFGSVAVTGSIPRSELENEVESGDSVESAGSYEGYSLYTAANVDEDVGPVPGPGSFSGSGAVAVGDDAVVVGVSWSSGMDLGVNGEAAVRTMIDASRGNARRLSATDGPAKRVQDRIGDSMLVVGAEVDPDLVSLGQQLGGGMGGQILTGLRGGGLGIDVDGETSTYQAVVVYESESAATEAGLADLVSGMGGRFEEQPGIDSLESEQDGAMVIITLTGDTETLAQQGAGVGSNFALADPR
ncbi:MAG: hypothetical protein ABEH64_12715 [Salinirussus sp.]